VSEHRTPTYPLAEVHAQIRAARLWVTGTAGLGGELLEFEAGELLDCVLGITETDFYKTMPSERFPGLWQDVYRTRCKGREIYLKLQIDPTRGAVVISFKER
jgi:motility quorum-sensing regulator/GCU-specific mRNA interferase toxin